MTATNTNPKARSPRKAKAAPPSPPADNNTLKVPQEDGKSHARQVADLVTRGDALNACTALRYVKPEFGDVDLSEMAASLRAAGAAVNKGDMSEAERMLLAQSVTLNAIFNDLARRSHLNMTASYLEATERYMRLALKAQSQCRSTLETLAAIKNPPIVYARQMNVAHGPQQVNNGSGADQLAGQPARTEDSKNQPNQLLEDARDGSAQLDARATTQAGGSNKELAAVGQIHGAQDADRQGHHSAQCLEGRESRRPSRAGKGAQAAAAEPQGSK